MGILTSGTSPGGAGYCVGEYRSHAPVAEWYTRQVEGLCQKWRGGSSPLGGTSNNHVDVMF
jgi:hypothetical protein